MIHSSFCFLPITVSCREGWCQYFKHVLTSRQHDSVPVCSPILEDLDIGEAAKALWEAPFAVLSHDKFDSEDPKFTYANKVWRQTLLLPHHHSIRTACDDDTAGDVKKI